MKKYNIYAGLSGGFNSVNYRGTILATKETAEDIAYQFAIEEYESYEGLQGLKTWNNFLEEYCEDNELDPETFEDIELIDEMYSEEIESWIEYYVVPLEEDTDFDKEEYYEI